MDFSLTDEQELLLESIDEWCARHITEQQVQQWYADGGVPAEVCKAYIDDGFGFLGIPEEYGGTPVDHLTIGLVAERIHRNAGGVLPFVTNVLQMFDMIEYGNEEQIKMCMDLYQSTGKVCFSLAFSEPSAGSDNMNMQCVCAERDGKLYLNGQKTWVSNGLSAPYTLVVAKDDDPSRDNMRMSWWLIPMDRPGVSTAPLHKIGNTIMPFCEIYFDDVEVTEADLVGVRGNGFKQLMKNFEFERCLAVANALGIAQAAFDDAAAYASERICFTQPISTFQLIQEHLTDSEIKLQNTRNMLYKCLWDLDNGNSLRLSSALLKRYGCKSATEVASASMEIFGGLGYTTETRVGRIWADCRGLEFGGGTGEIMVYIAGRQIAKQYKR